jgi:hypothetical protein
MGHVGSAGDNAVMKSFFSLLQKNILNQQRWNTRQSAESGLTAPAVGTCVRSG